MRTNRLSRWGFIALTTAIISAAGTGGCRVSQDDVVRWESTERGPDKLAAVITHDKYEPALRVQAAVALVRMKPRGGRRVGINQMVDAIAKVNPETRKALLGALVPVLVQEIQKPPPVAQAGQATPADGSIPYKDAAFALLTYDKDRLVLVAEQAHRQALIDALIQWVQTDFEHRYDNASQMYGLEQLITFMGAPAARPLAALIVPDTRKIPDLAKLIAQNGDAATKEEASKKLVAAAEYISSQAWLDRIKATVEEANRAQNIKTTPESFKAQLDLVQDEQLERLFGAMRTVGGRPAVEFCLKYASEKANAEGRRVRALAALEGKLDQKVPSDVDRILSIAASDECTDKIRDLAFARVGEMPREKVIGKLYEIFGNKKWQVRWVAAQVALKMSNTTQIPEFMSKIPSGKALTNYAMQEALSYGDWMGNAKMMQEKEGKTAKAQLAPYLRDSSYALRTIAIGYYYAYGTAADVSMLSQMEGDGTKIPKCDEKQKDCEWKCFVPKEGGKADEKEGKDVGTVGEFVKYCVIPAVKERK